MSSRDWVDLEIGVKTLIRTALSRMNGLFKARRNRSTSAFRSLIYVIYYGSTMEVTGKRRFFRMICNRCDAVA